MTFSCARVWRCSSAHTCGAFRVKAARGDAEAVGALLGGLLAPPHVYVGKFSVASCFAGTGISCGVSGSRLSIRRWLKYGAMFEPGSSTSDRKSTRLNSSHGYISYAVFCLKKKNKARISSGQEAEPGSLLLL